MTLTTDQKIEIMKRIGEEIQSEEELRQLFDSKKEYLCYDGFEPSGRIHIAQGLLKAINVNRMIKCGFKCLFYVADWFALLNNKCGGDLEKIRRLGSYFINVWKTSGMNMDGVKFVWTSEFIQERPEYWAQVLDIARSFNLVRLQRCSTIMGREESEQQPVAQILYPCMQASDIFSLEVDVCQLGIDQRKVNMLARDYATKARKQKPIIVSHHMLLGLIGGKMSKSIQGSSIFMDDTLEAITTKVMGADCPVDVATNPVLEYYRFLVFAAKEVCLHGWDREITFNGQIYTQYEDIEKDFLAGKIQAEDLKKELVICIDELIQPVRIAFETEKELQELQKFVIEMRATR